MMEYDMEELLVEVLKELRAKYVHMNEVHRLTGELGDALSRDDNVTVQMILKMRGKELESAVECDKHIMLFQSSVDNDDAQRLEELVKGRMTEEDIPDSKTWRECNQTVERIKAVWRQTVDKDQVISKRLAGKDSFYN